MVWSNGIVDWELSEAGGRETWRPPYAINDVVSIFLSGGSWSFLPVFIYYYLGISGLGFIIWSLPLEVSGTQHPSFCLFLPWGHL